MQNSKTQLLLIFFLILFFNIINFGQTVTDFDGNMYNTVTIGDQVWLKENLKSLHYSDGAEIPDVMSYNNSDSLAEIYGRLYTWNATMNDSIVPGTQGVCPCEWHVPTSAEWAELENFLGGSSVAGGKMKDTVAGYWQNPNTGATNSSGFSALPAGEFDAFYTPNIFQLLNQYAVFWTSTQASTLKARERYLAYNSSASSIYDWYKVMNYSIRCIKDDPTQIEDESIKPEEFKLMQNFPNPFNPTTTISYRIPELSFVALKVYDVLGSEIKTLVNEEKTAGNYEIDFEGKELPSGVYFYKLNSNNLSMTKKMILIR